MIFKIHFIASPLILVTVHLLCWPNLVARQQKKKTYIKDVIFMVNLNKQNYFIASALILLTVHLLFWPNMVAGQQKNNTIKAEQRIWFFKFISLLSLLISLIVHFLVWPNVAPGLQKNNIIIINWTRFHVHEWTIFVCNSFPGLWFC